MLRGDIVCQCTMSRQTRILVDNFQIRWSALSIRAARERLECVTTNQQSRGNTWFNREARLTTGRSDVQCSS